MANYLIKTDFDRYITSSNLDSITETVDSVWQLALTSVVETVSSYLRFRYDTDKEFAPIVPHVLADAYLLDARVIDGVDLYFAIKDAPANTALSDTAFWTKGDSRNQAIVDVVVVLTLYAVYSRINGSEIPNWIQVLYDGGDVQQRAGKMGYLKEIRKGSVQINLALLPKVEDGTDQSGNSFAYGSATNAVQRNTSI